jgi:hypothetical protein
LGVTTNPKEYAIKLDFRSGDALRHIDLVASDAGNPHVAPLAPRYNDRSPVGRSAGMLTFAVGLLVAAFGATAADVPARPQPTAERIRTESDRAQPTARQFAPPNQPDVSTGDARTVDELYRQLILNRNSLEYPPSGHAKR